MSKKIIVGITGSIAAYKAVQLISDLIKMNYHVEVMMSESAARFITPICIQSLTKKKVYIDTFDDENPAIITHVDIVKDADLMMIVPASAHTIAKIAHGLADNMLTSAFLAATCSKLIAPAMNVHMYENSITQKNIQDLKAMGIHFVEPDCGMLACGDIGKGKLAAQEDIIEMMHYALSDKPLKGKKVIISAGPTEEAIDPVRYITNHSSGKMGYALAKAAFCLGADVTLVSGPTHLKKPYGMNIIDVISANDMYQAIMNQVDQFDYIIMSAAVGDYSSKYISDEKIKKNDDAMMLTLQKNKDILFEIGQNKKPHQILCGFAMETNDLVKYAEAKRIKKKCDMIVANHLKTAGAGFQTDTNIVTLLTENKTENLDLLSKEELAYKILYTLIEMEK